MSLPTLAASRLAVCARSGPAVRLVGAAAPAALAQRRVLHKSATQLSAANPADAHGLSHWKLERALSVAVLGLVPAAVFAPSLPTDMAIATLLPLHNHLGMNVVITDYVHHPTMLSIANILNVVVGVATAGGLVYFNLNDVGICEAMRQLWRAGN